MLVGTVLYMSPEQVLGEELDVRTDVFALGSVFYHAFTGELAFPGKSFPEVCISILEADARRRRPRCARASRKPLEDFLMQALRATPRSASPSGARPTGRSWRSPTACASRSVSGAPDPPCKGRILIPPLGTGGNGGRTEDAERLFAGGLRRDLFSELERSTQLSSLAARGTTEIPRPT